MLVLSRKIGEQILIPELNITITVLSAGPNRVQVGINAPKEIDITRPEIQHNNRSAGAVRSACQSDPSTSAKSIVFGAAQVAVSSSCELAVH